MLLASVAFIDLAAAETCYKDDAGRIVTRRRPGYVEVPCPPVSTPGANPTDAAGSDADRGKLPAAFTGGQNTPDRGPRPAASPVPQPGLTDYVDAVPVPDRWRIVDSLPGYRQNIFDPYHRSPLKADAPIYKDWFFDVGLFSDSCLLYTSPSPRD